MKRILGTACLLMLACSGCATPPADYAAALSTQDPRWETAECRKIRAEASDYAASERQVSWAAGLLLGPYGLGLVAAGKEHQAKQRKALARKIHLRCSSQPLPKALQAAS